MRSIGITNISFFGADGSTQSYIDESGEFRYQRDYNGAQFDFALTLTKDRSITIRVAVFDNSQDLNELESQAWVQLERVLVTLGREGERLAKARADKGAGLDAPETSKA